MPRNYNASPTAHQRLRAYKRDDNWIRNYLQKAEVGHIATIWNDQPFQTPGTFWYDQDHERIIFHSNIIGRVRANIERNPNICVEVSELGKLLPSNVALEFSLQYRSVIVFGKAQILEDNDEKRTALYGLIRKYFPDLRAGKEYRTITDEELNQTSVYSTEIDSWSGKENWNNHADQSDDWPSLADKWLKG